MFIALFSQYNLNLFASDSGMENVTFLYLTIMINTKYYPYLNVTTLKNNKVTIKKLLRYLYNSFPLNDATGTVDKSHPAPLALNLL